MGLRFSLFRFRKMEGNMKKNTTRKLAETAMLIAVGTVLSLIKIDVPMGGGLTLCSMLPLIIISFRYGWRWGGFSAFVYSVLQLLLGVDNVQYASSPLMALGIILLDYILAYTVIGFASVFDSASKPRMGLALGIAVTFFARFLCHFITGAWIWDALWPNELGMTAVVYSAAYNGWYMAAELILTEIVAMAVYKPLGKYFRGEDIA